jgi:hypothetical protein
MWKGFAIIDKIPKKENVALIAKTIEITNDRIFNCSIILQITGGRL